MSGYANDPDLEPVDYSADPDLELSQPAPTEEVGAHETVGSTLYDTLNFKLGAEKEGLRKALGLTGNPLTAPARAAGKLYTRLTDPSSQSFADEYEQEKNLAQQELDRKQSANPTTTKVTDIGTRMLMAGLMPGGLVGQMVGAGGTGAVMGAGESKASLAKGEGGELLQDAALAGGEEVVGAGVGYGAGKVIGAGFKKGKELLRGVAKTQAFKAAHPALKHVRNIAKPERQAIGEELLDVGAVKFGSSAENIAENLAPIKDTAGKEIKGIVAQLDQIAKAKGINLPPEKLVAGIKLEARKRFPYDADKDIVAMIDAQADSLLEAYTTGGKKFNVGAMQGEKSRRQARAGYNRNTDVPSSLANKSVAHSMRTGLEGAAKYIDPNLQKQLLAANKRYSRLAPAEDIAYEAAARESAKANAGVLDEGAALLGILATGSPAGILAGGARRIAADRGNAATAVSANALAKLLGLGSEVAPRAGASIGRVASPETEQWLEDEEQFNE